jgi:hypothetical protein
MMYKPVNIRSHFFNYLFKEQVYVLNRLALSVLLLLLFPVFLFSQVNNAESFDGTTFPPTSWTREVIANGAGAGSQPTTIHWSRVTSGANPTASTRSGAGMAQFESNTVKSGGIVTLVSPQYDLTYRSGNTPTVSFWMYRDNGLSTTTDKIDVLINTTTSVTGATTLGTVNRSRSMSPTESADGWYQYSFNVPAGFSGASNYIIFQATSAKGNNMFIDDVAWVSYPPIIPSITGQPSSATRCSGASVSFTASASGIPSPTVQWQVSTNGGSTWTNISGATSTTYTFTVATADNSKQYRTVFTNPAGSTNSNAATLTVNPLPGAATGSNQSICIGQSVAIGASAVSGNTYSWSPSTGLSSSSVSNPTANPTVTTTYTLTETITATGCQNTNTVTVTVNPLPNANAGSDATICSGQSVVIGAGAVSGNTYSWSPSTGLSSSSVSNPTANPTVTTTYTLTETNTATGCQNTNTVMVTVNPLPTANAGSNQSICIGQSVAIGASAVAGNTYSWSPSTGLSSSSVSNPTANPTVTTTYTLTETITATGCQNANSVTVTVNPLPTANAGSDATICSGQSVSIGASAIAGNTYSWSPSTGLSSASVSNPTANPTVTTTYTLTETITATGCQNTNSVTVTVNTLPTVTVLPTTATICNGESVNLTASGASTYAWSPASGLSAATGANVTATTSASTTYTVTGTDGNGCTNSATTAITVNPLPSATAGSNQAICIGQSVVIGASAVSGNTYSWSPSTGLSSAILSNPTANPIATTTYTLTETITATGCQNTNTVTVTVNTLPTVLVSPNTATICNGESVNLAASGAASYSWSPTTGLNATTGANVTATPSASTTYTVTGTDGNGCINTATADITANPLPAANAGSNTAICSGQSVVIGASAVAGNTYSWSPSTGLSSASVSNPTANPTVTTTYTLTETITATGCQNTNSVTVTVNPLPNANAGSDATICSGQSMVIGAGAIVGNTYSWSPSTGLSVATVSNPTANPTVTTTYTLTETITATGCQNTNSVTVTVNTLPTVTVSPTTATICNGESVNLAASDAVTYAWSPASGLSVTTGANVTASPSATTTYIVTGTDGNGCTNSATTSITVNPLPPANAESNQSICIGQSVAIGANEIVGNTYSWSPSSGLSSASVSNPTANPTVTTTYTLTETITATGCQNTNTVTVTVNPLPNADAGSDATICSGQSVAIGASAVAGNTYSWSPSSGLSSASVSNPNANPTVTTTYTLTETITATGCQNTNAVNVTVNPLPTVSVTPTTATICNGESVNLAASGAASYAWSPASGLSATTGANVTATTSASTTYTVTGTDGNGCTNSATTAITVNPLPSATAGSNQAICIGQSVAIGANGIAGNTYSWSPSSGLSSASASNPNANPTVTTTYTLTETITATGCQNTNSVTVTVNPLPNADAGSDATICLGQSVVIGASAVAGNTYSWSPSTGLSLTSVSNPTADLTVTTTYTLTETITATGCQNTNTVTVTVNPLPNANAGSDATICSGQSVVIGASTVAGNTYSWSPSTGLSSAILSNPTANPIATTTYTLTETITATGCQNTNSVTVTINTLPTVSVTPTTSTICIGESVNLAASGAASYAWSPASGLNATTGANITATPSTTTTYMVTGTDGNGCSNTATAAITVNPLPSANAGSNHAICIGQSVAIGASAIAGNTYSWSPATGLSSTSVSNPTANSTVTTTYTLTETITATGCQNTNTVTVTVNPLPNANAGSDATICSGQSVAIGASAVSGNTYIWSPSTGLSLSSVSNPTANPTVTTTYILTETITATGCQNTNSVTVTVNDLPTVSVAPTTATICNGASVNLAASGASTYAWSPTSGLSTTTGANVTATPSASTTYTVTGTDGNGCINTVTAAITVNPLPAANAGSNQAICIRQSVVIGASAVVGNTYSWSPSTGLSSASISNPTANPTLTTTYTLTETITATGCQNTNTVTVTVNPLPNANAGSNVTICSGQSIAIGASAVAGNTYSWNPSTGLSSATVSNPTANPTVTTTYTLTETITVTGCQKTNTVTVTVLPTISNNSISAAQTICSGQAPAALTGSLPAGGNGSYTYLWESSTTSSSTGFAAAAGTNNGQNYSPASLTQTTWYRRKVTSAQCSGAQEVISAAIQITVNPYPVAPGAISGSATVCQGQNSVSFSVPAIANATGYVWTLPSGASILSGNNTGNITVNFSTGATSGNITVYGTNACGNGPVSSNFAVTVNPLPGNPTIPSGITERCKGGGTDIFTTSAANATSYNWSINAGNSSISGTSTTGTVSWHAGFSGMAVIAVSATNSCGTSSVSSLNVNVITSSPNTPSVPSGTATRCVGAGTDVYTTSSSGATTYSWSVTGAGNTILSSGSSATVTWAAGYTGTASVSVFATNVCGNSSSSSSSVIVTPTVGIPSAPSGTTTRCQGSGTTVYTTSATYATSYNWSVTGAGNTISGTGTSATITWAAGFSGTATVSVTANGCNGPSSSSSTNITVTPTVGVPTVPGGTTTRCQGSGTSAYTTSATDATSYNWSVTGSGNTISGTGTSATVTWAAGFSGTATVSVTANGCNGPSSASSVAVIVNPLPAANAGANQTICSGQSISIGASPVSGNTYSWSPSTDLSSASVANPTTTTTATITYTLTEIVTATGCQKSNSVTITVQPSIGNNIIGSIQTICSGQTPVALTGSTATGGNGSSYTYLWESSTTSSSTGFAAASGTNNGQNYSPASLTQTTWYRRKVTSGQCSGAHENISSVIEVTVLPAISNNNISAVQTICSGQTPVALTGSTPTGGNGSSYNYLWESSTTSSSTGFASASGTNNGQNYSPASLTQTTWFRRKVTSGQCSGAQENISSVIQITVNPLVGIPSAPATSSAICQGGTNVFTTSATNASSYTWSVSGAGNVITGTSSSATVTWDASFSGTATVSVIANNGCGSSSPVSTTVTVTPLVNSVGTISGTSNICAGQTGVSYSVPAIPNTTGYIWTLPSGATIASGNNTNNISVNFSASASSGNITVRGTNACGNGPLSSNFAVTVTALPAAAGTITGPANVCPVQSYTFSVPAIANATGYTWTLPAGFSITAGANTNSITVYVDSAATLTAGTIRVRGTNSCGNGALSPVFNINVYQVVIGSAVAQNNPYCEGGQKINLLGQGQGFGNLTWKWTGPNGFTSNNINPTPFGTALNQQGWYYAINTDENGCRAVDSVFVVVKPAPVKPTLYASGPTTFCLGDSVRLFTTTDTSYISYLWNTGATTTSIKVTTSGTYTITVTGSNGCGNSPVNAMTVTVNPLPPATVGPAQNICQGQSIQIGAAPVSGRNYNWTPSTGLNSSTIANPTASPTVTTTYTLTEVIAATTCNKSNSVTVNVTPEITNNSISAVGNPGPYCDAGGPANILGSNPAGGIGSYIYQWQISTNGTNYSNISGATSKSYTPPTLTVSTYYRRFITSGLCSSISTPLYFEIQPALSNNVITGNQTVCYGDTPTVIIGTVPSGGNGAFNFRWERSYDGTSWVLISGAGNKDYQPGPLTQNTYYRRGTSSGACANTDYCNAILVMVTPVDQTTWTGSVNTDWHIKYNWQCGIPDYTTNVIIPNTPNKTHIFNGNLGKCNTIIIYPGAHLTIETGGRLNVKRP